MRVCLTPLLLSMVVGVSVVSGADAPSTTRASSRPMEIRRGQAYGGGGSPEERWRRGMERMLAQVEPSGKGEVGRLGVYVSFFKRQVVQDLRTFAFELDAKAQGDGTVVLSGYAEYPEHAEGAAAFFRALGFAKVESRIERLPAEGLGEKRFGMVKVVRAGLYDRTESPREHVSEALLGDPLFLLKEVDGHYLCHSAEGYVGYVAVGDVVRVGGEELSEAQGMPRGTVRETTNAGEMTLPAGAHFRVAKVEGGAVTLRVPGAGDVTVPVGAVAVTDEAQAAARATAVIEAAKQFMGVPYVWGGKTLEGIDCSGLVQTAFQTQGVWLPRDADQQGYVGQLVATRWHREDLRAGDTLYFLSRSGRVSHTAIYVGNGEYIEASGPGVKVSSFDPKKSNYDERHDKGFCFGKRIMD